MQDFTFYYSLGWHHIISLDALDHIMFILVISAIYLLSNWQQVLVLVTAFTIGHSVTLALSVYDVIRINSKLVEFLIPCTIITVAVFNFFQKNYQLKSFRLNYFLALFFGLIHGMGFANTLRFILVKNQHLGFSLCSFNIGLEVGQIIIVSIILLVSFLFVNLMQLNRRLWVWLLSFIALFIATKMAIDRWIF